MKRIFIDGQGGLRAGWRTVLFLAVFALLLSGSQFIAGLLLGPKFRYSNWLPPQLLMGVYACW